MDAFDVGKSRIEKMAKMRVVDSRGNEIDCEWIIEFSHGTTMELNLGRIQGMNSILI